MVLLPQGSPLSWSETKKLSNYVRDHGIEQYINVYRQWKNRNGDVFKWGDEIEHVLVKFDDQNKIARLSLCGPKLLQILNRKEKANPNGVKSLWCPEYAGFMLESSPGHPYEGLLSNINSVEANMRYRRQEVSELLLEDEFVMTLSNFPRMGAPEFTWPIYKPQPENGFSVARSLYFPDEAICSYHARFKAHTRNIRERRGKKVNINASVFKDVNTKIPVEGAPVDIPDAVHMDAMGFGFGCCSLQVTVQACNLNEARTLYDQLGPLCPIMLALTAATPVLRGYLVDSDCRWNVIRAATDCRTDGERGEAPLKENEIRIPKYRFDSIDSYITPDGEKYNDVPLAYDEKTYKRLRDGGVDHLLAQYISQLFIRDVPSLFKEKVHPNGKDDTYHLDMIHKFNWRSIRLKYPINSDVGWRVEFRPCELQLTDFENAAIACFVAILTRAIVACNLNFLIPISKVDENMQRAQRRNACQVERFWFRKNISGEELNGSNGCSGSGNGIQSADNQFELMTIDQIMNGNGSSFPGLIPLVNKYLSCQAIDSETTNTIQRYLQLIQQRASGEILTTASWIRKEITSHPEYKKDSIVTDHINFDLLRKVQEIEKGTLSCTELHGSTR